MSILRKSVDWQARCRHEAPSQAYNKLKNHDLSHTCLTLIKTKPGLGQAGSELVATDSPPKQARPSRLFFRNPLAVAGLVFGSHWRPHRRGPARPAYTPFSLAGRVLVARHLHSFCGAGHGPASRFPAWGAGPLSSPDSSNYWPGALASGHFRV